VTYRNVRIDYRAASRLDMRPEAGSGPAERAAHLAREEPEELPEVFVQRYTGSSGPYPELCGLSHQRARARRALFQPQLLSGLSRANEIRVRRTRRAQLCLEASKLRSYPVRI
jgi:hypothetical protein